MTQQEVNLDEPVGALSYITYMVDNAAFNMPASSIKQLYYALNTVGNFIDENVKKEVEKGVKPPHQNK